MNTDLNGKLEVGSSHTRWGEAKAVSTKPRRRSLFAVVGLVLMLFLFGGPLWGESIGEELLEKVWIPAPLDLKRIQPCTNESGFDNPWLEPTREELPLFTMEEILFKPVACWSPSGERYAESFPTFAVRILTDADKDVLFSQEEFLVKVRGIIKRSASVLRGKWVMRSDDDIQRVIGRRYEYCSLTNGYSSLTNDSATIVSSVVSSNHQDLVEVVSKRYLHVDGRLFCLAVRDFADGGTEKAKARAECHVAWLVQWERNVRQCTREHRLKECGGDETKMEAAIEREIVQSKQLKREKELLEREKILSGRKGDSVSDQRHGERISIFDGFRREKKRPTHTYLRPCSKPRHLVAFLIVRILEVTGIHPGWVLGIVVTMMMLIVVALRLFIKRDWRCHEEPSDSIIDSDGVAEGLFKCIECGSLHRSEDAALVRLHGNFRMVRIWKMQMATVETVAKIRVPVCSACEKVLYDRIGSYNRNCRFVLVGTFFLATGIAFYLFHFTFMSSLFLGALISIWQGGLLFIFRGIWPEAFGVNVDAYFMRVEGLRKLKADHGLRIGKLRAQIQQQFKRSVEDSSGGTGKR